MSFVTTKMFSLGIVAFNLANVIWINDWPVPRMSRNCLGLDVLDIGQNLVPKPPAIITAKTSFLLLIYTNINFVICVASSTFRT